MITWVNINGFSPNLIRALILWRSGLGLLMGRFRQILMEFNDRPETCPNFRFRVITWVNDKGYMHWYLMKEIWFDIANGQIWSILDRIICPWHDNGWVLLFSVGGVWVINICKHGCYDAKSFRICYLILIVQEGWILWSPPSEKVSSRIYEILCLM